MKGQGGELRKQPPKTTGPIKLLHEKTLDKSKKQGKIETG